MMLQIHFSGWAQCRLATDPDPYDEPRGVSGYMRAYAGEPDLDRIIRFQDPPFVRSHAPGVGVAVRSVSRDMLDVPAHPLVGARVDLLDEPKFEGRNGAIAEDGDEPVVPFHLRLSAAGAALARSAVPTDPASPFREFNARDLQMDAAFIAAATGVPSIVAVWNDRLARLRAEAQGATTQLPAIEERIDYLERATAAAARGEGVLRFWPARMIWEYRLNGPLALDPAAKTALLGDFEPTADPWVVDFWFGGWDSDAQMFFVGGSVTIAAQGTAALRPVLRRPERMRDIDRLT